MCNEVIVKRIFSELYIKNFKHELNETDWSDICDESVYCNDADLMYNVFTNRFGALYEKHFPLKSYKLNWSKAPRHDWISKGLVKSCNKKSLLYKKYRKNSTPQNKSIYTRYRNKLKSILGKAERDYYRTRFKLFQGNLMQTWKLIGSVLNKNNLKVVLQIL